MIKDTIIRDDSTNWIKLRSAFIADSTYTFIYIGNFYNDNLTSKLNDNNANHYANYAYYYIDDICISEDSMVCHNQTKVSHTLKTISVDFFPNPVLESVSLNSSDQEDYEIFIYNNLGQLLYNDAFNVTKNINLSFLLPGIYYCLIKNKEGEFCIKNFIKN